MIVDKYGNKHYIDFPEATMKRMLTTIDETTGKLDRAISEMKIWAKRGQAGNLDEADIQTLKHHAEDMIAMGEYVKARVDTGMVAPTHG